MINNTFRYCVVLQIRSMAHSFETYNNWNTMSVIYLTSITVFICVISFVIIVISGICNCTCVSPINKLMFHFVKITFRDSIKKSENSPDKFIFYGYEIPSIFLFLLSTINLVVLWLAFVSFWASFLVDETFVCDPQLDCFLLDPSALIVLSGKQLDNCTSYDCTNCTVVCFQFVFDFNKGFSSTVGFISVAVIYNKICISLLIFLWELPQRKRQNLQKWNLFSCIGVLIAIVAPIVFAFATTIIILKADTVKTNESTFLNVSYCVCFIYVGPLTLFLVPCCVLKKDKKISTSYTDVSSINDEIKNFNKKKPDNNSLLNMPSVFTKRFL